MIIQSVFLCLSILRHAQRCEKALLLLWGVGKNKL